jgi:tetratricopeptide (TPR) repeat protein
MSLRRSFRPAQPEQRLFDQLSVFAGGWSVEAAQAVSDDVFRTSAGLLHAMARLVDTSLIIANAHGDGRFRMLDTLCQFGREQLALRNASDLARERHAVYFAELADRAEIEIFGAEQLRWHRLLELEQDNLRAALAWAAESHDAALLLRLASGVGWFWMVRGQWSEGRRWLDLALSMASSSTPDRSVGDALFIAGALAWLLGDLGGSRQRAQACLRVAEELADEQLRGRALINFGILEQIRGDFQQARRTLEQGLECARTAADRWVQGALWTCSPLVRCTPELSSSGRADSNRCVTRAPG